jgi:osmotically inducible lipoprotein OsmB
MKTLGKNGTVGSTPGSGPGHRGECQLPGKSREPEHCGSGSDPETPRQNLPAVKRRQGDKEMTKYFAVVLVVLMFVGACGGNGGGYTTAERTLGGGAVGAASGALIGAAAGSAATGAAIGGGAGLLGGYLYDQYQKDQGQP